VLAALTASLTVLYSPFLVPDCRTMMAPEGGVVMAETRAVAERARSVVRMERGDSIFVEKKRRKAQGRRDGEDDGG
jgi:hypothetical protein